MLLAGQLLLHTVLPIFEMFQQLHPRADAILMLVPAMKAPHFHTGRMMHELDRGGALVAVLAAVTATEDEMFIYILGPQVHCGGSTCVRFGEIRRKGHH